MILSQGKCGLSKCVTVYLVAMATADLLFVITDVILSSSVRMYFRYSFVEITPVCALTLIFSFAANDVSVWFTAAFTYDRFVAICCQSMKTKYCTAKMAAVILATISVLSISRCIPWWFTVEPFYIIDNVPWHCSSKSSFHDSGAWRAFESLQIIVTPCVPCFLILLLNVLTVRYILLASRFRRRLRCGSRENHNDPEMKNRMKSITLLFSISGSFLLLWTPGVMFYIYRQIVKKYVIYDINADYITVSTTRMLQTLSCCTNTCIYAVTQRKFREELKNAAKYPFSLIGKFNKLFN
ncbi:probable G-protein coupled receptor 139 [Scyliorhinus canicula]|uniref:probable G-protein coupled receptor 139 n=1 Tax=Scyliorhinus canicula TaxID=7830 RepID=UPI0018F6F7A8|nr:probable G-protein coupled receptor 139 [Scyliorhinus canicula]